MDSYVIEESDLALRDGPQSLNKLQPLLDTISSLDFLQPAHGELNHRLNSDLILALLFAQEIDVRI